MIRKQQKMTKVKRKGFLKDGLAVAKKKNRSLKKYHNTSLDNHEDVVIPWCDWKCLRSLRLISWKQPRCLSVTPSRLCFSWDRGLTAQACSGGKSASRSCCKVGECYWQFYRFKKCLKKISSEVNYVRSFVRIGILFIRGGLLKWLHKKLPSFPNHAFYQASNAICVCGICASTVTLHLPYLLHNRLYLIQGLVLM